MKLSFAIPTRNRAAFLGKALDRIIAQATDEVEIVIVDGASTDNTEQVVQDYKKQFARIRYFRRDKCIGVDRDIVAVVELAEGEYCWLLSDDDYLEDGAVAFVLDLLRKYPDISGATLNYHDYDSEMKFQVHTNPASSGNMLKSDHLFSDAEECFSLLGPQISFISTQVVKTTLWKDVVSAYDLEPYINDWLMPYIIGRMIQKQPKWLYAHEAYVRRRIDNDSFSERVGVYNRQLITHVAYRDTLIGLFGAQNSVCKRVFYSLLADRMARSLAVIKANGSPLDLQFKLFLLYTRYYAQYILYWVKIVPIFFIPNFIFTITRRLYLKFQARRIVKNIKEPV